MGCPVSLKIEKHRLIVIAIDGHPLVPKEVETVVLAPGERVDCVLNANQKDTSYWLEVKTRPTCRKQSIAFAQFNYVPPFSTHLVEVPKIMKTLDESIADRRKVLTTLSERGCTTNPEDYICISSIKSLNEMPTDLIHEKLDRVLYLPFDFVQVTGSKNFPDDIVKPRFNNLTFMFPSSPLISQFNDLEDLNSICNVDKRPSNCQDGGLICECVHIIDIPLNSRIELLLIDKSGQNNEQHVFHLHGGSFYVVGSKQGLGSQSIDTIRRLNSENKLVEKNLKDPILKDTVSVPPSGVVVVRFKADNPGYWLLHDQKPAHWSQGLDVILHVGDNNDLPPLPENFPRCGSWVGPEYFLI